MVFDSNCRRTRLYHCWNIVSKNLWLISYEPWIKSHQISATVPWRHGNLGILIVVKCRSYASSLKQAMHVIFVQKPISLRWSTTNSFISGVFETIAASNFGKSLSICALSSYLCFQFCPNPLVFRPKLLFLLEIHIVGKGSRKKTRCWKVWS